MRFCQLRRKRKQHSSKSVVRMICKKRASKVLPRNLHQVPSSLFIGFAFSEYVKNPYLKEHLNEGRTR